MDNKSLAEVNEHKHINIENEVEEILEAFDRYLLE